MVETRRNKPFREELKNLLDETRTLDFATVFVFIAVAAISTANYYYGNQPFFRKVLAGQFSDRAQLLYISAVMRGYARFVFSFILPLILIKWPLRAKLRDYGLGLGDWRFGLKITAIFIAVMLPIIWFASASESFARAYPSCPGVKEDWERFAFFAMSYIFYMTGWEFLWRGFSLFGLKEKLGYYSILVQTTPFVILHFGKPSAESFSAIFAGIALGVLAWRSRSFWYCMLTHTAVIVGINLLAVLRFRAGNYGVGLSDLAEIFSVIF